MTEAEERAIRRYAEALGLALPEFRAADRPELFAGWADRVTWALNVRLDRGLDAPLTRRALDECDRQLGVSAARAPAPAIMPAPGEPGWLHAMVFGAGS